MIIDDSTELLDVFKIIFGKQGYEVIIKTSAADIFEVILNNNIDLLLLDVYLENSNGRDICLQLKSDPLTSQLPIILISGTPENLIDPKECNADGYLEKPFNIDDIILTVNSCLKPS